MISSLPSFINQILLLLNSGMVLQEAMIYIAVNYKKLDRERQDTFILEYIRVYDDSMENRREHHKRILSAGKRQQSKRTFPGSGHNSRQQSKRRGSVGQVSR